MDVYMFTFNYVISTNLLQCNLLRLERQLKYKENEVWALKRSLKETKSKLNW